MSDKKTADEHLEALTKEVSNVTEDLKKSKSEQEDLFKGLREELAKKADGTGTQDTLDKLAKSYAEMTSDVQKLTQALNLVKQDLDTPLLRGGKDLEDSDKQAAIELQKRAFVHKGGQEEDFRPDMDNLVKASDYRSAARKMMKVGLENKQKVIRSLSEDERKAFDAASMDAGFFSPELLGLNIDCDPECASLIDLYDLVNVTKTTFQYPFIKDYGALGEYGCDATCTGPMGPEGNITWRHGRVNDFRGVFCLHRNVLAEANYDLLGFMFRSIQRSHRIQRNTNLMMGDDGWLTSDLFAKRRASTAGTLTATDFRLFMTSVPWDFGDVTAVMHQNMFAYLISLPKADGGFIFEDGAMCVGPDSVSDCIRISNCLPDPTENLTRGSDANPFAADSFLMAAANWSSAYARVEKRPLWIEQYEGGSSAWCVMYQFGAEDGGFSKCGEAGRTLVAGG